MSERWYVFSSSSSHLRLFPFPLRALLFVVVVEFSIGPFEMAFRQPNRSARFKSFGKGRKLVPHVIVILEPTDFGECQPNLTNNSLLIG